MSTIPPALARAIEQVRTTHAPDPRTTVFEVSARADGRLLVLAGATSAPDAADALMAAARALPGWVGVRDEVSRLPSEVGGDIVYAVVTAAVAPLLAGPAINETQVSQALLGHPLLVLRSESRWLHCRAPDGYIGWVHCGYAALRHEADALHWEEAAGGEPCIALRGVVRGSDGDVMMPLEWGARVACDPSGTLRLPDGRSGFLQGEIVAARERSERFPSAGAAVVRTAREWLGVPYLWGGITRAGVDCSGFVQAVYGMHGVTLPRDSDQQSRAGREIDPGEDLSGVAPGDLLFFAEEPGRCTHVVMSTGGSGVLHASLGNAGVARNDLQGALAYERELRRLLLAARRVLPDD